jgi:uncharacterized protein YbjT (DUF2867 family)
MSMILLAGATSSPGRLVADALLGTAHAVRVLVRSEADASAFGARGAEVVRGDVRDPEILAAACRGATTVVSMIGRHFAETREGLWAALDTHPARVVDLGGPEALTMTEGARRVAAVLGKRVWIVRLPRSVVSLMRWIQKKRFGVYELLLFTEMLCDHGYACDPAPARELLGRDPTSIDAALRKYYATTTRTPWRDSNFGALRNRAR